MSVYCAEWDDLSDRFHGWYKTTPKKLESVLQAVCYHNCAPNPISSLSLALAQGLKGLNRCDLLDFVPTGWAERQGPYSDLERISPASVALIARESTPGYVPDSVADGLHTAHLVVNVSAYAASSRHLPQTGSCCSTDRAGDSQS